MTEGRGPCPNAENWFAVYGDVDDFIFYEAKQDEERQEQCNSRR